MTIFALDIWNDAKKPAACVIPGVSKYDELFRSESPLPIPNVGETLDVHGTQWKVNRRVFFYNHQEDGEPCVKVDLYCSKVA